jgi:transposase-like protein
MRDEFAARQRAIKLRLGGRPVRSICLALGRSEFWFHKWWRRYTESGAEGRYDPSLSTQRRVHYHEPR